MLGGGDGASSTPRAAAPPRRSGRGRGDRARRPDVVAFRRPTSGRCLEAAPRRRSRCSPSGSTRCREAAVPARSSYPESAARALGARGAARRLAAAAARDEPSSRRESTAAQAAAVVEAALERGERRLADACRGRGSCSTAYGIPFVAERDAATLDEAVSRATSWASRSWSSRPCRAPTRPTRAASRSASPTSAAVREAAARIGLPVVVQPMSGGGPELIAGRRPGSGLRPARCVRARRRACGARSATRRSRLAPLTDADARGARPLRHGPGSSFAASAARRPPTSDALADLVHRLAHLADAIREVAELDLNPVLGLPDGCLALEPARVRRADSAAAARKTW